MHSYLVKKALLRLVIGLPAPRLFYRLCRFYHHTRDSENFGDMTLNGEVRFLRSQAAACRVLFDVGANRGAWTRHALDATQDAQIHCFEPLSALYQRLHANRFPERVVCHPVGLSDDVGERPIYVETTSLHNRRLGPADGPSIPKTETIRLTTLDAYCAEQDIDQIDFLKLDVEGHELAVLRGGQAMIRNEGIRRIQFEYGPFNIYARVLLRDFFAFFQDLPYDIYKITPRRLIPLPAYDPRLENFQYKNFAVLHHSIRP